MADPKYVKLVDHLARLSTTDISSGWGLSGLDVAEFPGDDWPTAQAYVRERLRAGVLVEASAQEFADAEDTKRDFYAESGVEVVRPQIEGSYQAHKADELASVARREFEAKRGLHDENTLSFDADKARREELIKQGNELYGKGAKSQEDEKAVTPPSKVTG